MNSKNDLKKWCWEFTILQTWFLWCEKIILKEGLFPFRNNVQVTKTRNSKVDIVLQGQSTKLKSWTLNKDHVLLTGIVLLCLLAYLMNTMTGFTHWICLSMAGEVFHHKEVQWTWMSGRNGKEESAIDFIEWSMNSLSTFLCYRNPTRILGKLGSTSI